MVSNLIHFYEKQNYDVLPEANMLLQRAIEGAKRASVRHAHSQCSPRRRGSGRGQPHAPPGTKKVLIVPQNSYTPSISKAPTLPKPESEHTYHGREMNFNREDEAVHTD